MISPSSGNKDLMSMLCVCLFVVFLPEKTPTLMVFAKLLNI